MTPAARKDKAYHVPVMEWHFWTGRSKDYCLLIPVINEGERLTRLLKRMQLLNIQDLVDIVVVDGGSDDGSTDPRELSNLNVRGLLIKTGEGKLSAQLRCGYAFCVDQDYLGVITIDGNDKDDPSAIPDFIEKMREGFDFVQGSRFVPGGQAENTPKIREFAIRYVHAPLLSLASGQDWTDTTQGFRAYRTEVLRDPRVNPFRKVFDTYELLAYLSYRVPRLGYRCTEIPTRRVYPPGKVPTKINGLRGELGLLIILVKACFGRFNP